jgi:hypothetical protein
MTPPNNPDLDQRLTQLETTFTAHRDQSDIAISELRGLTRELLEIAQLHQQALRASQENFQRNDERFREMREDIQRIWQYLVGQQNN